MPDRSIKEVFLLSLTALFFVGLGTVGMLRLADQEWVTAVLDLVIAGLALGLFGYVYITRNIGIPQVIMAWVFVIGALMSSYSQGGEHVFWSFPAITAAFFLLGLRHALVLCLLFLSANMLMIWDKQPPLTLLSIALALFAAILVAYSFALSVERQHTRLRELANIDPLTGVGNRRAQDERLDLAVAMFKRMPFDCSILVVDVDHFKAINDRHGHAVGDEVLVELVTLIRKNIRATETLFRYGGEEFVIVAERNTLEAAGELAERLRDVVQHWVFTADIKLTISLGVASLGHNEDSQAWFKRADDSLFQAKSEGRNRVVLSPAAASAPQVVISAAG